jgi:hypothetical protein
MTIGSPRGGFFGPPSTSATRSGGRGRPQLGDLTRIQEKMPEDRAMPGKKTKRGQPAQRKKPLTPAEVDRYMLRIGLISQLPDPALDIDDEASDPPVAIKGEPLSETSTRERR